MRQWLRASPNAEHAERGLRAIGERPEALAERYDAEAAVRRLRSEAGIDRDVAGRRLPARREVVRPQRADRPARNRIVRWLPRAVAAAAVLAVCLWGVKRLTPYGDRSWQAPLTTASTLSGEVRRLRLPDGSKVVLGPETTLRYRSGGSGRSREVWLEGEAHFAVAPAPGRQFRVYAAHGTAEDIGTTFTVRAYRVDSVVRVVVLEGAVVLRARGVAQVRPRPRMLRAGELGQLSRNGEVRGERVDPELYAAWTRDTLAFKDTPLRDVASQLRRWYGVDVVVDSALAARTLTGSFARRPLPAILDAVAAATEARHDWRGGRVVFAPR
jgi:transmembrane sensor